MYNENSVKKYPHLSLFHNVDFAYNSETTVQFTFIPQVEEEARTTISALLPYLRHEKGDWIKNSSQTQQLKEQTKSHEIRSKTDMVEKR
mmetsp:Transcript_36532/g.56125  ORF Transcript_36532/g.56125 Transcript_36532/m.56125 type:complete len:89 (+) Transcript_36532:196-462(+)